MAILDQLGTTKKPIYHHNVVLAVFGAQLFFIYIKKKYLGKKHFYLGLLLSLTQKPLLQHEPELFSLIIPEFYIA